MLAGRSSFFYQVLPRRVLAVRLKCRTWSLARAVPPLPPPVSSRSGCPCTVVQAWFPQGAPAKESARVRVNRPGNQSKAKQSKANQAKQSKATAHRGRELREPPGEAKQSKTKLNKAKQTKQTAHRGFMWEPPGEAKKNKAKQSKAMQRNATQRTAIQHKSDQSTAKLGKAATK